MNDGVGKRTTLLDSTGVSRLYQYDPVGRLTTQVDYDGSSTPIVTFVDGYDAVGNRTGRNYNGVVTTWVYDDAYRLTGQLQSGQRATFAYDPAGNITLKHHEGSSPMSMTFDAANRLVTTQQGSTLGTYTFDANGNMTGEQVGSFRITYVYDQENRQLQEIRSSGSRYTYTYEPDGLRRSAFHAGTADVVTFIWDGDDLLNERIEGSNAARYAVLEGEILSEKRGASRYRFVPDPLGSVRALLDTSGSITATRDYWPYGEVAAQSGGMTAIQFVGALGYFTDTTNRVYVRARHYRPDLGRWVTRDPLTSGSPGLTPYAYVGNSPAVLVDPSGLQGGPLPPEPKPGVGAGECPGLGAYKQVYLYIESSEVCKAAFAKVCRKPFASEVRRYRFIVKADCNPRSKREGSCVKGKIDYDKKGKPQRCRVEAICFNSSTCAKSVKTLACLLLLEVVNACDCAYHMRIDEEAAGEVIKACGLAKVCGPGGSYADGGGK